MISEQDIRFFLHLGYFPHYAQRYPLDLSNLTPDQYQGCTEGDLITQGAALWRKSIADHFEPGRNHVVPLSGGLDSRAILAVLLEHTAAENIITYTFGTPGTWDYDIGRDLAQHLGTRHTQIDLTGVRWSMDDLLETAKRQDAQTFLFHHVPADILDQFKADVIWSGYIGDAVTGGHLKTTPAANINEAKMRYLQNRREMKSIAIDTHGLAGDLGGGEIAPDILSYDEQVLFAEVGSITAPHVMPQGFIYKTPFINNDFMHFFMSMPGEYRINQNLFIKMLRQYWPDLFNWPSKTSYGFAFDVPCWKIQARRGVNRMLRFGHDHMPYLPLPPHPGTNFFDFNRALRGNESLRVLIRDLLESLKAQQVVDIDIDRLWAAHMGCKANHGDVFKILSSLAVNLAVKNAASRTPPP